MISDPNPTAPDAGHREDLKLAASKMLERSDGRPTAMAVK